METDTFWQFYYFSHSMTRNLENNQIVAENK